MTIFQNWLAFDVWFTKYEPEIEYVKKLLEKPLVDSPDECWKMCEEIEAYYGRFQYLLAFAGKYLRDAQGDRIPRAEKLTALEKEKTMKALCSKEEMVYDLIKGLMEAIEKRISAVQSWMKYQRDIHPRSMSSNREENR